MSNPPSSDKEKIDFREVLAVIWAHKILICIITGLSILYGGYYTLNETKIFTSTAVFQFDDKSRQNNVFSGELSSIARLSGVGRVGSDGTGAIVERIQAREFILIVSEKLALIDDPFFNSYNPNYADPPWKSALKRLLGWQPIDAEEKVFIENSILANFKKLVTADKFDGGIISISVKHLNPELAAKYANSIMSEIQNLIEDENDEAQNLRLSYLSETLADALQEMEEAEQNLKEYTLKNSAMAQENFISGTLELDALRMEKRKVEEIANVLSVIVNLIKTDNSNVTSYNSLRSNYPLIDDVDFRRILGMSETISAWSWPEIETVDAVSATLRDRIKRLDVEISDIEDSAKIYATSAEDLAKFTRNLTIAEATYTVLIEQVKSQSLAAGFQPNTFKVFEYATPSLSPSSPNRKLVLAFALTIGFFIGSILALANYLRKGVYYNRNVLLSEVEADLSIKSRALRKLSRWPLTKVQTYLSGTRILEVDKIEVKTSKKKIIYILNCGGRPTASGTARLLAAQSSASGRKVIICDKTGQSENYTTGKNTEDISGFPVISLKDGINILKGDNGSAFFTSVKFKSTMENLEATYDQIFVCCNENEATVGLMALEQFSPILILIARLRHTKKAELAAITKNKSVDILLYE